MNNKPNINLLFFDDDVEQKNIIETRIVKQLRAYEVRFWLIDPNDFYDAEHDNFSQPDFIEHIFNTIKGNHINLIASDWNLFKSAKFTLKGLDIIKYMLEIHDKYSKTPYILYSGNIDDASKYTLDLILSSIKEAKENNNEYINSIELIKNILNTRIEFTNRGDYLSKIIELAKGEVNLKSLILDSFKKYDLTKFSLTGNNTFDGKSLKEIISLVETDDIKGLKFIQEFTELAISYYTELND